MLNNIFIFLFSVLAIAYLIQLFKLYRQLRRRNDLWEKLGRPSLFSINGQRKFNKVFFRTNEIPITDPALLRQIGITKAFMFASVGIFVIAAATFFFSGKAGRLPR